MDNKLVELIEKCRNLLKNNHEYILCNQVLTKISSSILTSNPNEMKLELSEITNLTEEEMSMFSSPESLRIISALKEIPRKKGWRVETVFKLIKKLQQDIFENRYQQLKRQNDSLDELLKVVDEKLYKDKYNLLLDFIKLSVSNKILSVSDAINLNFYILNECSNYNVSLEKEDELEIIELHENKAPVEDIRKKLVEVFSKYEYVYDEKKMGDLDDKFVKYANIDYVDYVLSKFKEYGISGTDIYIRKRALCNIVIDNDRETFDSILDFINKNECSLKSLLSIPAIFAKRKRNYVDRTKAELGTGSNNFSVFGANKDFFENVALYKKRAGVTVIKESDLEKLSKFLCTSSSIVNKNLLLLEKYGIITKGSLPKAILALCGNSTEYIIDRMIELGLYESYLCSRMTKNGEVKQPRGTYFLDGDNNPFKFYKMKKANDMGYSILASNGGIRKEFKDNSEGYMGMYLKVNDNGKSNIVQNPLSLDTIDSIDPSIRKGLPETIRHQIEEGRISKDMIGTIWFNNLYKYTTFSPCDVFAASDKASKTNLKGDRVQSIFIKDFKTVVSLEEMKVLEHDSFIKLLDNAIYSDSLGNYRYLKVDDLKYEFSYPGFPNINIIVSRYKVLRLCKLLKDNDCWINQESSMIDKENTLLSVIIKDMIVSDTEMIVLRMAIRNFLSNQMIRVPTIKDRRGAR